ncbi:MAG: cysteine hydrolase family protein [Coprobacillaceae bacterium]
MSTCLLLIDVQNDYFKGGKNELYKPEQALENIKQVLAVYRNKQLPIIHIQHINTSTNATFFNPNTFGVEIHKSVEPVENEYMIIKHRPNSFYKTDLYKTIEKLGVTEIVICGMMTHMCVDTTVRACKDYELFVTLLSDACATKSLRYHDLEIQANIVQQTYMASLNGMFANVVKTKDYLENLTR